MLGFSAPTFQNFKDPKKMQGLLGDPIFMAAMGVLSNRKNRFAGGLEGLAASDKYGREIDEEKRQKALYELQMKTGEFNLEQAQEKKGKDIVAQTVIEHFQQNPYAIAFGGPKATYQQQFAGLTSRGVDPGTAAELIKMKMEEEKMKLDRDRLNQPADPYNTVHFGQDKNGIYGAWRFDARTGQMVMIPGTEGFKPIANDPFNVGAMEESKGQAQVDVKFKETADIESVKLKSLRDKLANALQLVQSGDALTGPGTVFFGEKWDEDSARIQAAQLLATVQQLKDSGLAPVSNADFQNLEKIFGDLSRGQAVNAALLEDAVATVDNQLAALTDKYQWYINKGTLRGYVPKPVRDALGIQGIQGTESGPVILPGSSPAQRGYEIRSR